MPSRPPHHLVVVLTITLPATEEKEEEEEEGQVNKARQVGEQELELVVVNQVLVATLPLMTTTTMMIVACLH